MSRGSILSAAKDSIADSHSTAAPENAEARADLAGNFIPPALIPSAAAKISAEVAAPISNSPITVLPCKNQVTLQVTLFGFTVLYYEFPKGAVTVSCGKPYA